MLSNVFKDIEFNVKCIPVVGGNYSDVSVIAKSDFVRDAINNYTSKVSPNLYATDLNGVGDDLIIVTGFVHTLAVAEAMKSVTLCGASSESYDNMRRVLCENLFVFHETGGLFRGIVTKHNFKEVSDILFKHNLFTECITDINLFFRFNDAINIGDGYAKFRSSSGKSIRVIPIKPLNTDLSGAAKFILDNYYPETVVIHNTNEPGNCSELVTFIERVGSMTNVNLVYTDTDVNTDYAHSVTIESILSEGCFNFAEVLYHIRPIYTEPFICNTDELINSTPCKEVTYKDIVTNLDEILTLYSIDAKDAQRCSDSFAIGRSTMVTETLSSKFITLFNLYCYAALSESLSSLPISDGILSNFLNYGIPARILYSYVRFYARSNDWLSLVKCCRDDYLNEANLREFSTKLKSIVREAAHDAYEEYCKEKYIIDLRDI